MTKYVSKDKEKYCNICGELSLKYTVIDNGICCDDCVPIEKVPKKIPNEKTMLNKILEQKKL